MDTIYMNYEITDNDRDENKKLKEEFIYNSEADFSKRIINLVKEGHVITIKSFKTKENIMQISEPVEVIDTETHEKKILQDIIKKPCYSCVAIINLNKVVDSKGKKSNREARRSRIVLKNGKAVIEASGKRQEVENIEKTGGD